MVARCSGTRGHSTRNKPTPDGQTLHGDHAYVFYQVPVNARKPPARPLAWRGAVLEDVGNHPGRARGVPQTSSLRRRFPRLPDLISRAVGARDGAREAAPLTPSADDQARFGAFRVGVRPNYYHGRAFSRDPEALNQFFRQSTPKHGAVRHRGDLECGRGAVPAGSGRGSSSPTRKAAVRGGGRFSSPRTSAVSSPYEPGSNFMFPQGEVPPPMPSAAGPLEGSRRAAVRVHEAHADCRSSSTTATTSPNSRRQALGEDNWRVRLQMARLWRDAVNRRGGDVTVVHLPQVGIHGNTHFPFSDLNNLEVADLLVPIPGQEGLGLTCGGNSRSGQLEQTSSARVARRLWDHRPDPRPIATF